MEAYRNEKNLKEKEYLAYIDEYIKNVYSAFIKYGPILSKTLGVSLMDLTENISKHDQSKYSEEEFDAYRNWFYTCSDEEKDEDAFNKAWKHHYTVNPHHPQYWDKGDYIEDMPPIYIAEMLLDWQAMKIKFGGTNYEYYQKERDKKPFSDNTKKILDEVIEIFK